MAVPDVGSTESATESDAASTQIDKVETRLDFAKQSLSADEGQLLDELAKKYQLQLYLADEQIERLDPADLDLGNIQPADISQSSRIGSAVQDALRDLPRGSAAGIVLFSDGVNNAGISLEAAGKLARQKAIPVFAVGLGSSQPPRDLEIADVLVDDAVF